MTPTELTISSGIVTKGIKRVIIGVTHDGLEIVFSRCTKIRVDLLPAVLYQNNVPDVLVADVYNLCSLQLPRKLSGQLSASF